MKLPLDLILIQLHGRLEECPLTAFLDSIHLFSGLSSKYLLSLHKEINFLVHKGYSYSDIMVMPTFSRRLFIKEHQSLQNTE